MERTKTEKVRHVLTLWIVIFSAIFLTINMNACGDKKNNDGGTVAQPPPGPGPGGCPTCGPQGGNVIASGFGQHDPNTLTLGITFLGQGGAPTGYGYSGSVSAQGRVYIGNAVGSPYCPIPAGVYTVNTLQPGQWYSSMVRDLKIEANGPARLTLTIGPTGGTAGMVQVAQPMIQYDGATYPNHLAGDILLETVNGQPCYPLYPYFVR